MLAVDGLPWVAESCWLSRDIAGLCFAWGGVNCGKPGGSFRGI